jgi:DNA primase catalytic core
MTTEQRARSRADKLEAAHATLARQVQALADGPQWQRWLDVAARFHGYSLNNTLLLLAQKPDATQVAGYGLWQRLGRQVNRGERGLLILAPVVRSVVTDDSDTVAPGERRPRKAPRVVGFRPTYVWDISQTNGPPLPDRPEPQLLAGQAPVGFWDLLAERCAVAGFSVLRRALDDGSNGYTHFDRREVVVRTGVDDAQAAKTLAHELGHVLLHGPADFTKGRSLQCRGEKEVEAEAVAYLLAAAHGLDTSDYTFAYVAGWASSAGDVEETLRRTADRVLAAARVVLAQPPEAVAALAPRIAAGAARTAELLAREAPAGAAPLPLTPEARLLAANAAAAEFYATHYAGSWAPSYLAMRLGWAERMPLDRLGYAPAGWTALTDHLRGAGFADDELLTAGLVTRASTGRLIDRFRDRLMFPIRATGPDGKPQVVGFVGRRNPMLDASTQPPPKYLNTPDTPVFTKGCQLYGLTENIRLLAVRGLAVLVEGPLDALAVDLAGRGTMAGLAPLGTAFTPAQAAALAAAQGPDLDRVVVATDPDAAGRKAAAHAYELLTARGVDPRGAALPDGMDPARLAEREGPAALIDRLALAEPLARQLAAQVVAGRDLRWAETQVAAARAVADVVMQGPASTWQRELTATAARTGLDLSTLQIQIVEKLAAAATADTDALGRLTHRERRDDLERTLHVPATAAQLAALTVPVKAMPGRPASRSLGTNRKLGADSLGAGLFPGAAHCQDDLYWRAPTR